MSICSIETPNVCGGDTLRSQFVPFAVGSINFTVEKALERARGKHSTLGDLATLEVQEVSSMVRTKSLPTFRGKEKGKASQSIPREKADLDAKAILKIVMETS